MPVWSITCAECGRGVAAEVVRGWPESAQKQRQRPGVHPPPRTPENSTLWLRCPNCEEGSVKLKDGRVFPSAPAGNAVKNLPPDVNAAWREARITHAVGAYTASEMVCRKILMHLAVDRQVAKPGQGFTDYVDALESGGYLPTGTKATVDKIRSRGNIANHDLPASTEHESLVTLGITEYLLHGIYEISSL